MKRAVPLTPVQRMALDSQRNIAVTASAGAGKTATLVERYIELLRQHPEIGVRQVLAITFTKRPRRKCASASPAAGRRPRPRDSEPERQRLRQIREDLPRRAFPPSTLSARPCGASIPLRRRGPGLRSLRGSRCGATPTASCAPNARIPSQIARLRPGQRSLAAHPIPNGRAAISNRSWNTCLRKSITPARGAAATPSSRPTKSSATGARCSKRPVLPHVAPCSMTPTSPTCSQNLPRSSP